MQLAKRIGKPNISSGPLSINPDTRGLTEAATLRAAVVKAAALVCSSVCTSAIAYTWRAGTSNLEIDWRISKNAAANGKAGINGTKSKNTFDTEWGIIIVLRSPMRLVR